ncbi:mRNA interferase PemK [Spirochaetia bacterium]|nr:mRNA interferase PemK [Spirochaetia bacterium]
MVNGVPMQGDIIKINLDPKKGHEQAGYRPYICLSHKVISDYANIAVFAPISNTKRQYPLYIPLRETETTGVILLDQLVTIDYNARQFRYIETVSGGFLKDLLATAVLVFQNNE